MSLEFLRTGVLELGVESWFCPLIGKSVINLIDMSDIKIMSRH